MKPKKKEHEHDAYKNRFHSYYGLLSFSMALVNVNFFSSSFYFYEVSIDGLQHD